MVPVIERQRFSVHDQARYRPRTYRDRRDPGLVVELQRLDAAGYAELETWKGQPIRQVTNNTIAPGYHRLRWSMSGRIIRGVLRVGRSGRLKKRMRVALTRREQLEQLSWVQRRRLTDMSLGVVDDEDITWYFVPRAAGGSPQRYLNLSADPVASRILAAATLGTRLDDITIGPVLFSYLQTLGLPWVQSYEWRIMAVGPLLVVEEDSERADIVGKCWNPLRWCYGPGLTPDEQETYQQMRDAGLPAAAAITAARLLVAEVPV